MSDATAIAAGAVGNDGPFVPFDEAELAEARRYSMLVQWSPEDGLWIVTVPELGNAKTHGATPAEAVEMGADLVASYLDVCRAEGRPVPPPWFFGQG